MQRKKQERRSQENPSPFIKPADEMNAPQESSTPLPTAAWKFFYPILLLGIAAFAIFLVVRLPFVQHRGITPSRVATVDIDTFSRACKFYQIDTKQFPASLSDLIIEPTNELTVDGWNGPYLEWDAIPNDPWGREYRYSIEGTERAVIISAGRDGKFGTADDISARAENQSK